MPLMSTSFAGVATRLHHRDEALATGEEAGLVASLTFCGDSLLDEVRGDVIERGREHVGLPLR